MGSGHQVNVASSVMEQGMGVALCGGARKWVWHRGRSKKWVWHSKEVGVAERGSGCGTVME